LIKNNFGMSFTNLFKEILFKKQIYVLNKINVISSNPKKYLYFTHISCEIMVYFKNLTVLFNLPTYLKTNFRLNFGFLRFYLIICLEIKWI